MRDEGEEEGLMEEGLEADRAGRREGRKEWIKRGRGIPCQGSQRPLPTEERVCAARGLCREEEHAGRMRGMGRQWGRGGGEDWRKEGGSG